MTGNKILIVEDSKTQAIKLQYLLENNNYLVTVAFNGQEALERISESGFDLIISDVIMPVMNGFELCEKLKKDERFKNIPIILLTALDKMEHVMEGLSKGADNYISKPYEENYIINRIDNVLNYREVNYSNDKKNLDVKIGDHNFVIDANPEKILNYFISSFNATVQTNYALQKTNNALSELTNTLENRVKTRTSQLEEEIAKHKTTLEELRIALDQTQKLDLLKTEFMNNLSHEIRTPMNSIMGFTELFQNNDLSEKELIGYLPLISRSMDILLKIITELIEAAETMTGYIDVKKSTCNFAVLFDELEKQYKDVLLNSNRINTQIIYKIPDNLQNQLVLTCTSNIKKVFDKLISNAIKFSERGKIEFGISNFNDNKIEFYVKDEGIGIEKAQFDEIFECFKQLEQRDHNKFQGTGVGLAIAKKITEHLGGSIWLQSEPGKGSAFYFTLPHYGKSNIASTKPVKQSTSKKNIDIGNLTILIAEDVRINYIVVKAIADLRNITLYWAKDGREAIEMYEKFRDEVDLILMDIQMPEMNGMEATRIIREKYPHVLIIALTAYATDFESEGLREKGFNALIKKPVRPSTLMEIIENEITVN